jgi:Lipocalin-like domain
MVSFQVEAEGTSERRSVYDDHPMGFLIITTDGRMMALITAGARAQDGKPSALFESMMAYSGRYRLQGDSLVTKVDSAWHPGWVGTEQTRFISLDGNTLTLTSPLQQHPSFPDQRVRGTATWRKE